ncbi:hypothetical protein Tco_0889262 [Tanacetum coccineum]
MPLFPSPEPSVRCIDDLDFFKDFENEFPAIVYNDALTSKSDFSTEPTLCPQHIDEFDLKNETSLSKYDEVEPNVLYFNDLFPFNIIYPDDQKSDKGNDENTNKLIEESYDKIRKVFIKGSFIMVLNMNIMAWNYFVNRMLFNLIKNLYVPFSIPFDPKRYYKDGDYERMLRRPRIGDEMGLDVASTLCFQLRGARRSMTWRQFILALGLHTAEEMAEDRFGAYWLEGAPSYTYIRDPVQRLCDMLISYNIYGKEQAPKMVTATDLFYPRNMDRGAANVPYLLAQYLFRHAEGRKSDARLSGCHFIRRLAHHFGLVALRLERQQVAMAGALEATEDAPSVDEGAQVDPAPVQAPQPPPPPPTTEASGQIYQEFDGTFQGSSQLFLRDTPDRGLARPAPLQHDRIKSRIKKRECLQECGSWKKSLT